jgi:hypothetical protein
MTVMTKLLVNKNQAVATFHLLQDWSVAAGAHLA